MRTVGLALAGRGAHHGTSRPYVRDVGGRGGRGAGALHDMVDTSLISYDFCF